MDRHAEHRDAKRKRKMPVHGRNYVRSVVTGVAKRAKKLLTKPR